MWTLYTILAIIIIILITKATIKLKFGFWGAQPVFHIYDLHYWIYPPGIINHNLPTVNKYVNHINIKTNTFSQLSSNQITKFCQFIRAYYLPTYNAKYFPSDNHVITPFLNNKFPSYLTTYQLPNLLYHDNGDIIHDKILIGIISARPLTITLPLLHEKFPVYYVDNLCIHPDYRKKGIAPSIIQTHHYHTRYNTPDIKVHLFKREGELTAIIPLVSYFTYMYLLPDKVKKMRFNSPAYTIVEVTKYNINLVLEFIYKCSTRYSLTILPEISSILNSISKQTIVMYILLYKADIIALYVFQDPSLSHNSNKALLCSASLKNCDNTLFIIGFSQAIRIFNKKFKATSLLIESISDNTHLINNIPLSLVGRSPTAYFLYNYVCRSILPEKSFILI